MELSGSKMKIPGPQRTMELEESKGTLYKSSFNVQYWACRYIGDSLFIVMYFATFHLDTFEASDLARLHSTNVREQQ